MRMSGPRLSTNLTNSSVDRPTCDGALRVTPHWRLRHLLHAPHRLAFFMGAMILATSALWWEALLLARALHWELSPVVPAPLMHALLMSLGAMPLFFCGLLIGYSLAKAGEAKPNAAQIATAARKRARILTSDVVVSRSDVTPNVQCKALKSKLETV